MAINDVLPLKAVRRDSIANLKCFGAPAKQQPNFDGCIYTHYAAPPYSAHISAISSFHLAKFGWAPFADLCVRRLATKQNAEFMEGAYKLRSDFEPFINRSS